MNARPNTPLKLLICVAAPAECERVLAAFDATGPTSPGSRLRLTDRGGGVDLLATGVGPTAAGVSAAQFLATQPAAAVVSLGIAGAFPASGIDRLATVLSTGSVLAGEGRTDASGFTGLAAMGFGPFEGPSGAADRASTSPELVNTLRPLADHEGQIATVSTVSGTDDLAQSLETRTGAVAEAMEGAAVHLACHRAEIPFAEIRVISNIAGDRERHPWKLVESLDRLGPLAVAVADALAG